MLINPSLIAASERRFKQADFSAEALNRKLGDGPIQMTVEQKRLRRRQLLAETHDVLRAEVGLERIIQGNDLDSINYLAKGTLASRSVCRVQLKDAKCNLIGYASGFLIGPELIMTNHHVFGRPADATNSLLDFDYELDISGMERPPVRFCLAPGRFFYTNVRLDFSIVAVAPRSQGPRRMGMAAAQRRAGQSRPRRISDDHPTPERPDEAGLRPREQAAQIYRRLPLV